jgi:uncharacterized protein YcnI
MKKILITAFAAIVLLGARNADAHVTVSPSTAGIGAWQTFTVNVPSEKDSATIQVRLLIPEGLESVTPTTKAGWSVRIKKSGEGDSERVSELSWTGGSIPPGQRDEFTFSAKVPAAETTLQWKSYQIYVDGAVVAWDKASNEQPKSETGEDDFSRFGPYSETNVVNDLAKTNSNKLTWEGWLSIIAIILSVASIGFSIKQEQKA